MSKKPIASISPRELEIASSPPAVITGLRGAPPEQVNRGSADASSIPTAAVSTASHASPHARQGDRGSADDPDRRLPKYVRFADLVDAGIVRSWPQLFKLIKDDDFPVGVRLSANVRAWRLDNVQAWLSSRPVNRKPISPLARKPHQKRNAEASP